MHGNVWEWWFDAWHDSYNNAPTDGSAWQGGDGSRRVLRGGSWLNLGGLLCRATHRIRLTPDIRDGYLGFRLVLVVRTR